MTVLNCISALDSIPQPEKPTKMVQDAMPRNHQIKPATLGVYPNPVRDHFFLTYPVPEGEEMQYRIYNELGELVGQGKLNATGVMELGIKDEKPSTYILEVFTPSHVIDQIKITKQ